MTRGAAAVAGVALLALVAACEGIVTDAVPSFSCLVGSGTCPAGQTCDLMTRTCVESPAVSGTDAGLDGAFDQALDAVAPPAGCSSLGCQCAGPSDCSSALCADTRLLSTAVYDAADKTSFCTAPCCTSADCDSSTVCLATGLGVSYCVRPEWLARSTTLGTVPGGGPCENDGACRSGLCASGICEDVCCSSAQSPTECSAGSTCQFGTFPGRTSIDTVYVPSCQPMGMGTGITGTPCTDSAQCRSDLCTPNGTCHDACRNTADCNDPTLECGFFFPTFSVTKLVTACETTFGTAAQGGQGAPCSNNNQCQSGFCDAQSMACTDVCYGDGDCTPPGWTCRLDFALTFDSMNYTVFTCGP